MVARLRFFIATEVDPDVLIIDEVLAVGDEHFKKKCNQRISGFQGKGVTMLFVTHTIWKKSENSAARVLWLERGSPKMCGDAGEVTKE